MLRAKQLEKGKFLPNSFSASFGNKMRKLQQRLYKKETRGSEDGDLKMLIRISQVLNRRYEEQLKAKKVEEVKLNECDKFGIILSVVTTLTDIHADEIKLHRNFARVIEARYIVMFCARWALDYDNKQLGEMFGGAPFHHTTVTHACKVIVNSIRYKDKYLYPLVAKVILSLRDEGINIDLDKSPYWYEYLYDRTAPNAFRLFRQRAMSYREQKSKRLNGALTKAS